MRLTLVVEAVAAGQTLNPQRLAHDLLSPSCAD